MSESGPFQAPKVLDHCGEEGFQGHVSLKEFRNHHPKESTFPAFYTPVFLGKYNARGVKCGPSAIWGVGGWSDPLLPGYEPGKGGWGTVWMAGVHATRMIRPMHPILYLHI